MYYLGRNNGYIQTSKYVQMKIEGYIASLLRMKYYSFQNRLFYQYDVSYAQKVVWRIYKLYFRVWKQVKKGWL